MALRAAGGFMINVVGCGSVLSKTACSVSVSVRPCLFFVGNE